MTRAEGRVLLVEDEPDAVRVAGVALRREGFEVVAVADAAAALASLEQVRPDVVVTDHLLPGLSGLELLRYLKRRAPDLPVVLITGHGDERLAVEAMRLGAFMYLPKPLDYDELSLVLERAVELARLRRELREARLSGGLGCMIGESEAMHRVRELIAAVGPTDVSVLILGETGSGKELVARALHEASRRSREPFVAVNCAAIPETLLEAELFGWVRGAFTGAEGRREGKFVSAHRGTLLLDEIGDMPAGLQPKLLRVLEEGTVTPLGSDASRSVDVRVLAASHRNLEAEVAAGRFRADLFYRLNVVPLTLPPLRERHGDIPLLVSHFLPRLASRHGKQVRDVDPALVSWLEEQTWPGNVRELENTLERLVVLSQDGKLRVPVQAGAGGPLLPFRLEKQRLVDAFEREYLVRAVAACDGRLSRVAEITRISPRQLYTLLRKHGLASEDEDPADAT